MPLCAAATPEASADALGTQTPEFGVILVKLPSNQPSISDSRPR